MMDRPGVEKESAGPAPTATRRVHGSDGKQFAENRASRFLRLQRTAGNQAVLTLLPEALSVASRRGVARAPRKRAEVQRAIDQRALDVFLETGTWLPLHGLVPTNADKRDREETRMLAEELALRYPGGAPNNLVTAVVASLNAHPINTFATIRAGVTAAEAALGLPSTRPLPPTPGTDVQRFIELLKQRRGSYNWAGGTSAAFRKWINGPNPLEHALPVDAQINCWEAVIASAVETGLIPLGRIRGAYAQRDVAEGVLWALTRRGRQVINHNPGAPGGANGIQVGNVIMISGADGPLHHVVVATQNDRNDYLNTTVMSLWNGVGGGGFTQTNLDSVLPWASTTIQHASL